MYQLPQSPSQRRGPRPLGPSPEPTHSPAAAGADVFLSLEEFLNGSEAGDPLQPYAVNTDLLSTDLLAPPHLRLSASPSPEVQFGGCMPHSELVARPASCTLVCMLLEGSFPPGGNAPPSHGMPFCTRVVCWHAACTREWIVLGLIKRSQS